MTEDDRSMRKANKGKIRGGLMMSWLVSYLIVLMLPIIAVYHAFGLSEVSSMELITMGVLLYIGASYTPLPGASGAQEGGFAVLFKGIFPDARLFVALLIWRFSTYYLNVIVGAVVATVSSIRGIKNASDTQEGVSNEQS